MKKVISFQDRLDQLDLCVTAEDYKIVVNLIKQDFADEEKRMNKIKQLLDDDTIKIN